VITRTLSYAIVGIALGYGYGYLVQFTEFLLRKLLRIP
jgi:hypothetical protein